MSDQIQRLLPAHACPMVGNPRGMYVRHEDHVAALERCRDQVLSEVREAVLGDAAIQALYSFAPMITSDNDAGSSIMEDLELTEALTEVWNAALATLSPSEDTPFASIDEEDLEWAKEHPGIQRLHKAADQHIENLVAEGRIDGEGCSGCPDCKPEAEPFYSWPKAVTETRSRSKSGVSDGPGHSVPAPPKESITDRGKIGAPPCCQPVAEATSTDGRLEKLRGLVDQQAEDKTLWRDGLIADALHLQLELRRLHDAVNLAAEQMQEPLPDQSPESTGGRAVSVQPRQSGQMVTVYCAGGQHNLCDAPGTGCMCRCHLRSASFSIQRDIDRGKELDEEHGWSEKGGSG